MNPFRRKTKPDPKPTFLEPSEAEAEIDRVSNALDELRISKQSEIATLEEVWAEAFAKYDSDALREAKRRLRRGGKLTWRGG